MDISRASPAEARLLELQRRRNELMEEAWRHGEALAAATAASEYATFVGRVEAERIANEMERLQREWQTLEAARQKGYEEEMAALEAAMLQAAQRERMAQAAVMPPGWFWVGGEFARRRAEEFARARQRIEQKYATPPEEIMMREIAMGQLSHQLDVLAAQLALATYERERAEFRAAMTRQEIADIDREIAQNIAQQRWEADEIRRRALTEAKLRGMAAEEAERQDRERERMEARKRLPEIQQAISKYFSAVEAGTSPRDLTTEGTLITEELLALEALGLPQAASMALQRGHKLDVRERADRKLAQTTKLIMEDERLQQQEQQLSALFKELPSIEETYANEERARAKLQQIMAQFVAPPDAPQPGLLTHEQALALDAMPIREAIAWMGKFITDAIAEARKSRNRIDRLLRLMQPGETPEEVYFKTLARERAKRVAAREMFKDEGLDDLWEVIPGEGSREFPR